MKKIAVMSKHMANLIAAGEVVERPANVVKELMENSIDAGASKITVEIKNGGKSYIRITDNGSGIGKEDLPLAFVSHATSKIKSEDDLESIATLGFRGEALASICAVSHMEVLTRAEDEAVGTSYVISGGKVLGVNDAGCPQGTTMIVRDLFYNTPARMKFLKKDVSEANKIASIVDNIALSHPEVAVNFIREGKNVLSTSGDGNLKNAVFSIFGKEFFDSLIELDYELSNIRVWGFISKPTACKPNRSMQHFFVSGRQVKSVTAMAALDEAYKNSVMVGKVPACVLHIDVDSRFVDVNVHPAKTEVRFQNDKSVYDAVYYAAKNALSEKDGTNTLKFNTKPNPQVFFKEQEAAQIIFSTAARTKNKEDFWQRKSAFEYKSERSPSVAASEKFSYDGEDNSELLFGGANAAENAPEVSRPEMPSVGTALIEEKVPVAECEAEEDLPVSEDASVKFTAQKQEDSVRVVGEIFKTYIIAQRGDEVLFIDKHAAHERMIFERLKSEEHSQAQMLLNPVCVTLNKEYYQAITDNTERLEEMGFIVEDFGAGSVRVLGYPVIVDSGSISAVVEETAKYLAENRNDLNSEFVDWLYHNIACREAIKAGKSSSPAEMEDFVTKLLSMPEIRYCPHGRPVMISMTKYEFEKQFGRVQ